MNHHQSSGVPVEKFVNMLLKFVESGIWVGKLVISRWIYNI